MIEHLPTQNINQALFLSNDEIIIKGKMMQRVKIEMKQGESAKYHFSNIEAEAYSSNEEVYRMIISEDLEQFFPRKKERFIQIKKNIILRKF